MRLPKQIYFAPSGRGAVHADAGNDHGLGQAGRPEAGPASACGQAGGRDRRHRDLPAAATAGAGGEVAPVCTTHSDALRAGSIQWKAHDECILVRIAVVSRPATGLRESKCGVEGDRTQTAGAHL